MTAAAGDVTGPVALGGLSEPAPSLRSNLPLVKILQLMYQWDHRNAFLNLSAPSNERCWRSCYN